MCVHMEEREREGDRKREERRERKGEKEMEGERERVCGLAVYQLGSPASG